VKILVIDGQGGGIGKALITAIKLRAPALPLTALGTNATATTAMLRAGADQGATGENAICYQCKNADIIIGVIGILHANALLGEISPAIASAISGSDAQKLEEKLADATTIVVQLANDLSAASDPNRR